MLKKIRVRPYYFVFVLDIILIAISFIAAVFYHNRNLAVKKLFDISLLTKSIIHILLAIILWIAFKINKRIIKHYKASDFVRLICVAALLHLLTYLVDIFYTAYAIKFGIVAIVESFLAATVSLILVRYSVSFLYEKFMFFQDQQSLKRVLIYGAGERGILLKKSIESSSKQKYLIVGFIDDDVNKISRYINGVKIYSQKQAFDKFISTEKISRIIIATNKLSPITKSNFIKKCLPYKIKVKQIDAASDWYDSDFNYNKLSNININDLMGREVIKVDTNIISENLFGKTAIVTGAAGSIGSELVRKLSENNCENVVCIDFSESALYDLQQEQIKKNCNTKFHFELADIRDRNYLNCLFTKYKPQVLFHAAAYKHVPMMEEFPWQAVYTNVVGTWNLAQLSIENNIEKFILISTDKAVNPSSLMGVTKRLAEIVVRSLANQYITTKFCITRFGNVLGSNGSVLPLFKKQIMQGGPVTITHPNMERFFMTIPEACCLVLEAYAMGKGEEVFVFDMGKPVKIKDLATNMIKLAGYEPEFEIKIEYIGIRKGEKLSEEIFSNKETLLPTHHNKIFISGERKYEKETAVKIISRLTEINNYNTQLYKDILYDVLHEAESVTDYNLVLKAI